MNLRKLFKVRQPGNGSSFEKRVESAAKSAKASKPIEATSKNRMGGVKTNI